MKKLFVSLPMKGRSDEEIKASTLKMKSVAEAFEGCELELIDSFVEEDAPEGVHPGIWYLGESIKRLSQADVYIGIEDDWPWNGCHIENETANRYDIKVYLVRATDIIEDYEQLCERVFRRPTDDPVKVTLF